MNKTVLLPLLSLALCAAACSDANPTLRLMTYNVGAFNKYDRGNYADIAAFIGEMQPDIVCLNELDSCTARTGNVFQLERLAQLTEYEAFVFGRTMPYRGGAYGNGILCHDRMLDRSTVALPGTPDSEPRAMTIIETPECVVAVTHLDYVSPEARVLQVETINHEIERRYGNSQKPIFLCGDMNSQPQSEVIAALRERWTLLTPTDKGSYPAPDPDRCIDYIFQFDNCPPCSVIDTRVVEHAAACDLSRASDHLPVWLEVRLPEKP